MEMQPDTGFVLDSIDIAEDSDHLALPQDVGLLLPSYRLKRAIDLILIVASLPVVAALIAIVAIAVRCTSRGPVFYSQRRIGRGGREFNSWKFRTMVPNAEYVLADFLAADPGLREEWEQRHKLCSDPRITSIGRLLRRTSLDELPQLWNVLMGEMTLVGPRPIVADEVGKYGAVFVLYTAVVPGITGLWQVSGRNDTTYDQRVEYDRFYIRNWSPWMDLQILSRTVSVILSGTGAY